MQAGGAARESPPVLWLCGRSPSQDTSALTLNLKRPAHGALWPCAGFCANVSQHRMLLALSAIGIGTVAGWSLSGFEVSAKNLLVCLLMLSFLVIETKVICQGISIGILSIAMIATFGFRLLLRALYMARTLRRM